jgi:acetyl-CoA carboxylase biotin carboxyl carrier protein
MDFKAIEAMIKTMDDSKLGYLEVNWQGISIVMRKQGEADFLVQPRNEASVQVSEQSNFVQEIVESKIEEIPKIEITKDKKEDAKPVVEDDNIKEVVSPIVGTFYGSASPDKPSYVKAGSKVKKGDTLCIIEAMKLMNEIQSEVDGEIVEILVDNQQMVEYGQAMFKIRVQ